MVVVSFFQSDKQVAGCAEGEEKCLTCPSVNKPGAQRLCGHQRPFLGTNRNKLDVQVIDQHLARPLHRWQF